MSSRMPLWYCAYTKKIMIPDGTMQIHDKTHLSIRAYMKQSGWQNARLKTCPANPGGDCRLHRHGTYTRKYPDGMRVARFYCRSCQKTFSLLPTFMAAGCPGTLDEIGKVVLVYEECGTLNGSLRRVSAGHGCNARTQRRWLQRRVVAVHLLLATVKGLFPDLYGAVNPTLASFRYKGPPAHTLVSLRLQCEP